MRLSTFTKIARKKKESVDLKVNVALYTYEQVTVLQDAQGFVRT